ncbi:hypothetical protein Q4595_10930 [Wenyingzhuangia sp. 1_MG-2023]|nr:hypothetical protein [Wenyingzhuangia sp. 1_MG-2023]
MKLYNKIRKNIKYGLFFILTFVVISCTDDIDSKAFGEPVLEDFYETPEQAEQALIAAYSSMSELYGSNFLGNNGFGYNFWRNRNR